MTRTWWPCRVCGASHKNPHSSSICSPCGQQERNEREAAEREGREEFESSQFGQFMSLSEEERWERVFDWMEAGR